MLNASQNFKNGSSDKSNFVQLSLNHCHFRDSGDGDMLVEIAGLELK